MSSWHSYALEVSYRVLGWVAFSSWSLSFYPQAFLNHRRKSVVGLNFDFLVFNLTKHTAYLIYNASLYFSETVQRQYRRKYGHSQMIPVAVNDVAFSIHAVLLTGITVFQLLIYERGHQRVSKICIAITTVVWIFAAICFFVALRNQSWLWLVSMFNLIRVAMTAIKYIPQALMNFIRKSTVGWSIGNIILDVIGGVTNFLQMFIQSLDQRSLVNLQGNIGKTLLSLEVVLFDVLFIVQHYILYPLRKDKSSIDGGTMPYNIGQCDTIDVNIEGSLPSSNRGPNCGYW